MVKVEGYGVRVHFADTGAQRYVEFFSKESAYDFLLSMYAFLNSDDYVTVTTLVSYKDFQGYTSDSQFQMFCVSANDLLDKIRKSEY